MVIKAWAVFAVMLHSSHAHYDPGLSDTNAQQSHFYSTQADTLSHIDTRSLDQAPLASPGTRPSFTCIDIGRFPKAEGTTNAADDAQGSFSTYQYEMDNTAESNPESLGTASRKTCFSQGIEAQQSPHQTDGLCGSEHCNGYDPLIPLGQFNEASGQTAYEEPSSPSGAHVSVDTDCTDQKSCSTHVQRKPGRCYRDSDCQFYQKDSQGLISGEIVGKCVRRSDTDSMCECAPAYFGANCEFKRCPRAKDTGFMCNGVQGEGGTSYVNNKKRESYVGDGQYGEDYYGPLKMGSYPGSYMGSEWNTYDEILTVDFDISVDSKKMQRGTTYVGGTCDFETGRCNCHPTWYGPSCERRRCPFGQGYKQIFPTECSGQGECVPERAGQNSICSCHNNFHGLDCSLMQCPNSTRGFICDNPLLDTPQRVSVTPQSGHQCDWAAGHCKCVGDFFGPDCTWKKCPKVDGRVCNGQGVCYSATHYTSPGSSTGYGPRSEGNFTDTEGKKHNFAPTFTDRTTQSAVAGQLPDGQSGNTDRSGYQSGQKYGVCSCRWPFYGVDCALRMCPNSTNAGSGTGLICDGHGACDHTTGFCTCEPGHYGRDCHLRTCPFSENNQQRRQLECNGEGTCDRALGKCICSGATDSVGFYDDWREHEGMATRDNYLTYTPHGVQNSQPDGAASSSTSSYTTTASPIESHDSTTTPHPSTPATDHDLDRWLIGVTAEIAGTVRMVNSNEMAPSARNWRGDHEQLHQRFWGKACEKLHCPSYPDYFSQHGLRSMHTEHSHDGDDYRDYTNECSGQGHGDCDVNTGKCICKAGWYGLDCSQKGKGDGTANRRMHLNYDATHKLRPDGTLKNSMDYVFRENLDRSLGDPWQYGSVPGANPNGLTEGSLIHPTSH